MNYSIEKPYIINLAAVAVAAVAVAARLQPTNRTSLRRHTRQASFTSLRRQTLGGEKTHRYAGISMS